MKKTLLIVVAIGLLGAFYFLNQKEAVAPMVVDEQENVKIYLRENIAVLSPVSPVLGGNWYVISFTVDLEKNSGTVVYEDGHIQEKRNFLYTANQKGEVVDLKIE